MVHSLGWSVVDGRHMNHIEETGMAPLALQFCRGLSDFAQVPIWFQLNRVISYKCLATDAYVGSVTPSIGQREMYAPRMLCSALPDLRVMPPLIITMCLGVMARLVQARVRRMAAAVV